MTVISSFSLFLYFDCAISAISFAITLGPIVLDASLILNVECVTQANSPNFPWGLIHFLMMQMKND